VLILSFWVDKFIIIVPPLHKLDIVTSDSFGEAVKLYVPLFMAYVYGNQRVFSTIFLLTTTRTGVRVVVSKKIVEKPVDCHKHRL